MNIDARMYHATCTYLQIHEEGGGPHGLSPSPPRGFSRFPLNRRFLDPGDTSKHSARVLRSILPSSIRQKVGFRAPKCRGSFFPCPSTWRQFLDLLQDHLPGPPDKKGRHQQCLIGHLGHGFQSWDKISILKGKSQIHLWWTVWTV